MIILLTEIMGQIIELLGPGMESLAEHIVLMEIVTISLQILDEKVEKGYQYPLE